jgi:hypothetical protein
MLLLSILMFFSPNTQAWDEHHVIMERMLETRASKQRVYPYRKITMPCPDDERKELEIIGKDLHINTARVPIFSTNYCKAGQKNADVMINDMMTSSIIDEPDHGMDQDLPESEDPHHYRRWMGGDTGPTSQGFRHMYFPGFDIWSPLKTFQVLSESNCCAPKRIFIFLAAINFGERDFCFGSCTTCKTCSSLFMLRKFLRFIFYR